jgi:hypothetical protein
VDSFPLWPWKLGPVLSVGCTEYLVPLNAPPLLAYGVLELAWFGLRETSRVCMPMDGHWSGHFFFFLVVVASLLPLQHPYLEFEFDLVDLRSSVAPKASRPMLQFDY